MTKLSDFKNRFVFISFLGLFFIGYYIFKVNVNSTKDLIEIKGTLKDYSFQDGSGIRNHTHSYYIHLDNYKNSFKIPADFFECFYKEYFERDARIGDSIILKISQAATEKINTGKDIFLFSIKYKGSEYLVEKLTIVKYNSALPLYFGLAFFILGVILWYREKRKKEEKLPPTNAIANAGMRVR